MIASCRYLSSFLGDTTLCDALIGDKVRGWVQGIESLAAAALKFPQSAHAGLLKSYQHRWTFMQRVIPQISARFAPVEAALKDVYLTSLFGRTDIDSHVHVREMSALPIRHGGLSIPKPVVSASLNNHGSCFVSTKVLLSVQQKQPFDLSAHVANVQDNRDRLWQQVDERSRSSRSVIIDDVGDTPAKALLRRKLERAGENSQFICHSFCC